MGDLFDFDQPASLYAVMGNPVAHSHSPQIHQMFAEQFGLRVEYQKIQVDVGGLPQAVANFRAAGGHGLNITLPFKLDAFRLADELSPRALLAEAVTGTIPGATVLSYQETAPASKVETSTRIAVPT